MGMDVYGRKPIDERGEYFRNNVWWWRPLADFITEQFPGIAAKCQYWHSNDGDGLGAKASVKLADAIDEALASGMVDEYAKMHEERIAKIPREDCNLCDGTGIRTDEIGNRDIQPLRVIVESDQEEDGPPHPRMGKVGWCNGCGGYGTRKSWESHYPFSVDNVREFSTFARYSGGFRIC